MEQKKVTHIDAIFGQVIVSRRSRIGMDQKTLAAELGVNQSALSRLEKGESASNIVLLVNFARVFHCAAADLIKEFEEAIRTVKKSKNVSVLPKKELEKKNDGLALAISAAALLYLLTSK